MNKLNTASAKSVLLTKHSETSEKALERYLRCRVEALNGLCLKYSSTITTGYPDRLCIIGGRYLWVELKSAGKHPTRLQTFRHRELHRHGALVAVCDSRESIDLALKTLQSTILL